MSPFAIGFATVGAVCAAMWGLDAIREGHWMAGILVVMAGVNAGIVVGAFYAAVST